MKILDFHELGNGLINIQETGLVYQLTETGLKILKLLKKGKTLEQIKKELLEEFDVEEKQLYIDLEEYLRMLKIHGMIR